MRKRVVFAGVGALGSNAVVLCRELDVELVLVDFDSVESKNLASQAFVKQSLRKNKAVALAMQLRNFWDVTASSFPVRMTKNNVREICKDADLVVDAFDNAESRRVLSGYCGNTRARFQIGYNPATLERDLASALTPPIAKNILVHVAIAATGDFGLVRWDERFQADEEDVDGQATCEGGAHLPFIGLLSAALAMVVQEFLSTGRRRDLMVSRSGVQTTHLEESR